MEKLSAHIKKLREKEGFTLDELAKKLKLGNSGISKWERGRVEPSLESVRMIADYFKEDYDKLLAMRNAETKERKNRTNKEKKIIDIQKTEVEEGEKEKPNAAKINLENDSTMSMLREALRNNTNLTEANRDLSRANLEQTLLISGRSSSSGGNKEDPHSLQAQKNLIEKLAVGGIGQKGWDSRDEGVVALGIFLLEAEVRKG